MKMSKKYVFYGGMFGVALATVALAGIGTTSGTGAIAFVAQTDTSKTTAAELGQYQQLDCKTVTYDIAEAQLALSGPALASAQNVQLVLGQVNGKGTWDKLKRREVGRSASVRFNSKELEMVTFTFNPPVKASTLCPNPTDMAYLRLDGVSGPGMYIHGSLKDSYAGPLFNCVLDSGLPCTGTIIDMAFSLLTLPNNPPVIDEVSAKEVKEMETLTFTLRATDPDGGSVTWGSGNLPEGATLNSATGEFSWTPTSDQVQDYKITFVATDDGGPIQESSSVTVFVSVVNVDTTSEDNQLLMDTVISLTLENSVENSYLAHLKNVETFIERGQVQAAQNQLEIFIKKADEDLAHALITQEQHDTLVKKANDLLRKMNQG